MSIPGVARTSRMWGIKARMSMESSWLLGWTVGADEEPVALACHHILDRTERRNENRRGTEEGKNEVGEGQNPRRTIGGH